MSEYKGIKGYSIQSLNQDAKKVFPGEVPNTGQVWFASDEFFYLQKNTAVGTWSTVNNMNTARNSLAGAGTQTSALSAGGGEPSTATAFIYDGTSWTAVGSMTTAREFTAGAGTQTSALAFGSRGPAYGVFTEEFTGGLQVVAKTVTGT